MPAITEDTLEDVFSYHPPTGTQLSRYAAIRAAAKRFAEEILDNSPGSPEQQLALRHVQMATMLANAAIACNEIPPG